MSQKQQVKQIEAEIAKWRKYATENKKEADYYQPFNFVAWNMAHQRYCFALQKIAQLEKEIELVKAGWGSITA